MYKNKGKICATIEARMTSSRLPGKVLMDFCGKPDLLHIIERLKRSKYLDEVLVATTTNKEDDPIVELCERVGCKYYRGSEDDVLLRVLESAESVDADCIVEITGDCPVIDWRHVDHLIEMFYSGEYDYASNSTESIDANGRSFPVGFNVKIFTTKILKKVNELTKSPVDHEHVSLYIYTHPEKYRLLYWNAEGKMNHPELEITLDTKEDYEFIKAIYERLYTVNQDFSAEDVVDLLLENPELCNLLQGTRRKDPFKQQKDWEENHGRTI